MDRNFDDYTGFQPFRSWTNTYAQDCTIVVRVVRSNFSFGFFGRIEDTKQNISKLTDLYALLSDNS